MLKSKKGYIYPFIMQSNVCMSQKDNVGWMTGWLTGWMTAVTISERLLLLLVLVLTGGCCIMKKFFQEDDDDYDGLLMD